MGIIRLRMTYVRYLGLAVTLFACSTSVPRYQESQHSQPPPSWPASSQPAEAVAATELSPQNSSSNLEQLWETRIDEGSAASFSSQSFTLGPGDLLRISVPSIDELKDRRVRVSEEDTIALPLLGIINVSGMTEEDLRQDLLHRLKKYMYQPQVEVFLEHTENREVAVLGSVRRPGRYMLASHNDTIMTMISHAGGVTEQAASRLIFVPVQTNSSIKDNDPPERVGSDRISASSPDSLLPASLPQTGHAATITHRPQEEQFLISLSNSQDQRYLDIPAKPGDVIIVPAAGQVTVQGWVDKPGAFPITQGLTVLGSIAAAGGATFTSSATLLREETDGSKISIPLDLSKIKRGEQPDLPVQGGDVVIAERSAIGAVPYTLYFLINRVGIGMGMYY
jgi:polysaccharide biosynthesis/export protein